MRGRNFGPMITVKVTDRNLPSETFYVHENVLCAQSDFFRKACQGSFRESAIRTIELKEEDPEVFSKFLEWIYFGDYEITAGKELDELFSLYIFADKIQTSRLKNEIIDKLMSIAETTERQKLSEAHIRLVFANTPSASKLRDWIVRDAYFNDVRYFDDEFRELSKDHPDFFFQLGGALAGASKLARASTPRKSSYKIGVFPTCPNCHFHEHDEDAYCEFLEVKEQREQKEIEKRNCIAIEVKKEMEKERKSRLVAYSSGLFEDL